MIEIRGEAGVPSLWLDALEYAGRVVLAGRDPFANAAELAWASREVQSLVRADFVALPVAAFLRSRGLADADAKERPARALRAFLSQPSLREALAAAARVLGELARASRGLVVSMPSPGRLLRAFGATGALDEDDVDAAAVALADFLRTLQGESVVALRVDADADELKHVALHTPISNIAAHYGWWTLLTLEGAPRTDDPSLTRTAGYAADSREAGIIWLDPGIWAAAGSASPDTSAARLCVGVLPADADPAQVIAMRAQLRAR